MNTIGDIDKRMAEFYAPLFLEGVKYGESQINVWIPGSGKTVVVSDILVKRIPKTVLIEYSCDQTEKATAREVLENIGLKLGVTEQNVLSRRLVGIIADKCRSIILKNNKSILLVGTKFESLPNNEYIKLLDSVAQIVATNKRKIYSIINCIDYPLVQKIIYKKPSISVIANRIKFIPIISGKLLLDYIYQRSAEANQPISREIVEEIAKTTGGILSLTKEIIRYYPDDGQIDAKYLLIWNQLPKIYQDFFSQKTHNVDIKKQLTELGIINLSIFKQKELLVVKNPLKFLEESLGDKDKSIFKLFVGLKNKLVTKDQVAEVIWGENYDEFYSDWTIDQIISRFRKRIAKLGISSESLVTLKGRGYKWGY